MQEIVFATNNAHKLSELRQILGHGYVVHSLSDIGCYDDIPETADTLEGNAEMKARYIKKNYGYDCFADDTGLEVDALGGAPGVYSARYAGPGHDSEANMKLLLENMQGVTNRRARFRTVIALVRGSDLQLMDGEVSGSIIASPRGKEGFGYDPVFMPDGCTRTFAEMSAAEKNSMSHRARAVEKLRRLLTDD